MLRIGLADVDSIVRDTSGRELPRPRSQASFSQPTAAFSLILVPIDTSRSIEHPSEDSEQTVQGNEAARTSLERV